MSDRHQLTVAEAISVLSDGDAIHTYSCNGILIGADWTRDDVIRHIQSAGGAYLAGPMATNMGHGLCIDMSRSLFAATDAVRLAELEARIASEPAE